MQTLSVKVARKILEADDIVSFELRPVDDVQLPPFSAGSHVDVQLRSGLVRQYSLCNHSDETHRYMIGVLRDLSGSYTLPFYGCIALELAAAALVMIRGKPA